MKYSCSAHSSKFINRIGLLDTGSVENSVVKFESHNEYDQTKITQMVCLTQSIRTIAITAILSSLLLGLPLLIIKWSITLRVRLFYERSNIEKATHLLVFSTTNEPEICKLERKKYGNDMAPTFSYLYLPYYWNKQAMTFRPVRLILHCTNSELLKQYSNGFTCTEERDELKDIYSNCNILIPVPPFIIVLLDQLSNPFYVFQVFSVTLWMFEKYYYYASLLLVMASSSIIFESIDTRKNLINIRNMASAQPNIQCKIPNTSEFQATNSNEIIPGDIIKLTSGMTIPCDSLLLSGTAIINEGMLTGESVPVTKHATPLNNQAYDSDNNKMHLLFAGTRALQTSKQATALIVKIGFLTAKGALIRSILKPTPIKFNFYKDSLMYIAVMAFLTLIGFSITFPRLLSLSLPTSVLIMKCLDLITIAVPPALPTILSIGVSFAIMRLKKEGIYCLNNHKIIESGKISSIVFDKTGTLTEEGLSLNGVCFTQQADNETKYGEVLYNSNEIVSNNMGTLCMACCHSLNLYDHKQLIGDPMEIEMLKFTNYCLWTEENDEASVSMGSPIGEVFKIIRILEFSSEIQMMSTIVQTQSQEYYMFSKGSPEKLKELCFPTSIPADYSQQLLRYTEDGYRVIALGYKPIKQADITQDRSIIETGITLIGLLLFVNKVKQETPSSIEELQSANINCVMATGDNLDTAISVSKKINIIPKGNTIIKYEYLQNQLQVTTIGNNDAKINDISMHNCSIAITGPAFNYIITQKKDIQMILEHGKIYARMKPEDKAALIQHMQTTNQLIAMCGDGANDCSALKAADVGLSLSETEASIAAPFTSKKLNISSMPALIKEGRAALVTSVQCFKFLALYSMIQFTCVIVLYFLYSSLSNMEFFFQDMCVVVSLGTTMSW